MTTTLPGTGPNPFGAGEVPYPGPPEDAPGDELGTDLAGTDQEPVAAPGPPRRARRGPDYRLRGLELDEPAPVEQQVRRAPKNRLRRRARRRVAMRWGLVGVAALVAALGLRAYVAEPFSVPSAAMVPTLQVGDRILVVKARAVTGPIKTGDIIVFRQPADYACPLATGQDLVKRVVATPGQTIWSKGNRIYVNGKPLREAGWYNPKYGPVGKIPLVRTQIPAAEYFVLGDNRADSCDSRSYGPIPASIVIGKVVAIVLRGSHPFFHIL